MQPNRPGAPPFRVLETGWRSWLRRRWLALGFTAVSIAIVVYLAIRSSQPTPQTATEAGLFAVLAALANILGAIAFARVGTVTPQHARSSVRRLLTVARTLTTRYTSMTRILDSGSDKLAATEARIMTAEVQTAILSLQDAINDWNEVHGEALAEVLRDAW